MKLLSSTNIDNVAGGYTYSYTGIDGFTNSGDERRSKGEREAAAADLAQFLAKYPGLTSADYYRY